MRELHFMYRMSLSFSAPASRHEYTLKCFPQSDEMQKVEEMTIQMEPKNVSFDRNVRKTRSTSFVSCDSFGNKTLCGMIEQQHQLFQITVKGVAKTGLLPGRNAKE